MAISPWLSLVCSGITLSLLSHGPLLTCEHIGLGTTPMTKFQVDYIPKDFISKFEIALKECNESDYWLTLLRETAGMSAVDYERLAGRCDELRRMLISSVTTLKGKGT